MQRSLLRILRTRRGFSSRWSGRFVRAAAVVTFATALFGAQNAAAISRDPNGVNVNAQGATTVFITFGGLQQQTPVEAMWCGELISAAPDIGFKCDPSTIYGRLPIRLDQSRLNADSTTFTDIMSIPPSVARRAWQAAERGEHSAFYYVRRFVSTVGGPDEYVFVTCRLAGGGARVPLALLDVRLSFAVERAAPALQRGEVAPPVQAEIRYNGSGRLKGRWEIVAPGEDPPSSRDLLTEATLPPEERALQRRYTQLERFNVFLPPTGKLILPGPDPKRLPTEIEGLYHLLLRIEASDDKEGDSNLALAEAGTGIVHSGAVAGFPIPPLRYYVGNAVDPAVSSHSLTLLAPGAGTAWPAERPLTFSWSQAPSAMLYRLEIAEGAAIKHSAIVQQGVGAYLAPSWLTANASRLRWRVIALGPNGEVIQRTDWRTLDVSVGTSSQNESE
jgi:hypothetical protein